MGKRKHSHDTKIVIKYYYERIRQNTGNFLKWMGLSVLTGLVVGGASAVFAGCIKAATEYRDTHNWIFMLLPVAGVLIVFMYEKIGRQDGGTNQVLATIKSKDDVPFLSAPLIFCVNIIDASYRRLGRKRRCVDTVWWKYWKLAWKTGSFR